MSTGPAYLPPGVSDTLRLRLSKLADDDARWKIARLAERAFAEGYDAGYMRAYSEAFEYGRAAALAQDSEQ